MHFSIFDVYIFFQIFHICLKFTMFTSNFKNSSQSFFFKYFLAKFQMFGCSSSHGLLCSSVRRSSGFRRILHRFRSGPSAAQPTRHGPSCGEGGLRGGVQPQPGSVRGAGRNGLWAHGKENFFLFASELYNTSPHQLSEHDRRGHQGPAEEVRGEGQPPQVCFVQADAPQWTGWAPQPLSLLNTRGSCNGC